MATYQLTNEQKAVCEQIFKLRVQIDTLRVQRHWALLEYRKANEHMVAYRIFLVWCDEQACEKTRRFYHLLRGLRDLKNEQSG